MPILINKEVKELLSDKETLKVLATTDASGVPHAVIKQSLFLNENGQLAYLELIESSKTNKNLVASIWFNQKVSIVLKGKDGQSYEIIGTPVRALVTGPVFQKHYVEVRQKLGDVDLAAVWIINPESVRNQSFVVRRDEEDIRHPTFKHLDRIAKVFTNAQTV